MAKLKVTIDGEEKEIEVSDSVITDAGFVAAPEVERLKAYQEKELERVKDRFDAAKRKEVRAELMADEAFRRQVVADAGGEVNMTELREQITAEIEKEKVAPVQTRLSDLTTRLRDAKVRKAAEHFLDLSHPLVSIAPLAEPFEYDPKRDDVFTQDGKSAEDHFRALAQTPEYHTIAKDLRQNGSDFGHDSTAITSKTIKRDQYDKLAPEGKLEFAKAGGQAVD